MTSLSLFSLDTAETGSGDHENYFVQLDLKEYLTLHKNGSYLEAQCENKAVRIRPIGDQRFWPNIAETTLLFSSKNKFYTIDALDALDMTSFHTFHKAIKPKYG